MQVYPGFWFDTGIAKYAGTARGCSVGPASFFPEEQTSLDVDREEALAAKPLAAVGDTRLVDQPHCISLQRGGKLIFVHGVSDAWFSAQDTTQLLPAAHRRQWRPRDRDEMEPALPGAGHGPLRRRRSTLDRFDMLTAIVDWVEKGVAPDAVIATGAAFPGRS